MNKNIAVTGKGYARPVKKFCDIRDLVVLRFDSVNVRVVYLNGDPWFVAKDVCAALELNRPGFPGECFICELRLPDHRFRWKHNKLFLLLP
ncbi:hypothetical protein ODQ64_24130, partial [Escherichia coli]|nr:hypothetical protein [Escherichia coli]